MLAAYTDVVIFFLAGVGFVGVTLTVGRLLRPHNPYPEKLTPYECGEIPVGEGQVPFNIRYYIFALLFVVFDVEVVFLFPWAVVLRELGMYAFILMVIFLVMLVDGLVYAWKKGVLRWV